MGQINKLDYVTNGMVAVLTPTQAHLANHGPQRAHLSSRTLRHNTTTHYDAQLYTLLRTAMLIMTKDEYKVECAYP